MAGRNGDYPNSKVGIEQGAERIFVDSDGYFNAAGNDISGNQMDKLVQQKAQQQIIINSAGVMSTLNLPSGLDLVVLSVTAAASNASAYLCSEVLEVGQKRLIILRGGGVSVGKVVLYLSGMSIIGTLSGDLSSISLTTSATSFAFVQLLATDETEWSVIGRPSDVNGCVVEQASA